MLSAHKLPDGFSHFLHIGCPHGILMPEAIVALHNKQYVLPVWTPDICSCLPCKAFSLLPGCAGNSKFSNLISAPEPDRLCVDWLCAEGVFADDWTEVFADGGSSLDADCLPVLLAVAEPPGARGCK